MEYLSHIFNFIWNLLKYAALLVAAILILAVILLAGSYRDLKGAALGVWNGKIAAAAALAAIQAEDWSSAAAQADSARQSFSEALSGLERTHESAAVKHIKPLQDQLNELEHLLKAGEILSASLVHVAPLAEGLDRLRSDTGARGFHDLPAREKQAALLLAFEMEPELKGLKANLDLALLNLSSIHEFGLLWPLYGQISDIKRQLETATALTAKVSPALKLLPVLAGYPAPSRFLLILQNNDELRPSGGFIGTYGILEMKDGEIVSLSTDDSYHLDRPAALSENWQLEPPAELKKYLETDKWYLRDANWSPDWPTAAAQIQAIYRDESAAIGQAAGPLTAVVALTPDLVADLIRLAGPLSVRGVTYDADNFQPLLQYKVEVGYKDDNIAAWDRKELINEVIAALQKKLAEELPKGKWRDLAELISADIDAKDIQIYFPDAARQALAHELGASGEIKREDGDYLLVADANLGAFKSDAVVKKDIDYEVSAYNGGLNASLKLSYRHEGGFDWRTTRYRSYTRVYAPRGSEFISLDGLDTADADFKVSDDLQLDKTVFGFYFTIEPGADKEINLAYRLPSAVSASPYQLLVQRQAGSRIEELRIRSGGQSWTSAFDRDEYFRAQ